LNLTDYIKKFEKKEIIVIQGLGFVGSAMSLVCANAIKGDYGVIGVDLPNAQGKKIVSKLNNGIFPFKAEDPKIESFFQKSINKQNFFATTEKKAFQYADVIIVDINLDVIKKNDSSGALNNYDVDISNLKKAIKSIGEECKEDVLVLVETTVPPGTCKEVIKPILYNCLIKRKLSTKNIRIGHSYERVMPGPNYIDSIQNYYRVYSGINKDSANAVENFLKTIISTDKYPLTRLGDTNSTEMAKVLENSYRAMNIAFMVEWSRFAEEAGVDLYNIVKAIRMRSTHANMMYPGIGVGGYCLTKDALLASWSKQNLIGDNDPLYQSETSININDQMPRFAFEYLIKHYSNINKSKILLLGISYRGDVGDSRFSPVEKLYDYLINAGAIIDCHDPYLDYWHEKELTIEKDINKALSKPLDLIIISAGHSLYRKNKIINLIADLKSTFIYDTIGHLSENDITKLKNKHTIKVLGRGDI